MEECDGTDLGTNTCVTRGYGSGTVTCTDRCFLDTGNCSLCVPDPSVVSCEITGISAQPLNAAIAANDSEVAVAWTEVNAPSKVILGFARLSPTLDVISSSRIDDAVIAASMPSRLDSFALPLAVAALPSGWVVAGYVEPDLYVHAMDPTGADLGRTTVETFSVDELDSLPVLVPRPSGGPLLAWQRSGVLRAVVVSDDGRSISTPRDLYGQEGSVPDLLLTNAAYVGDAFYLVLVSGFDPAPRTVRLLRIESDGTSPTVIDDVSGVEFGSAMLANGAADLRMIFWGSLPSAPTSWGSFLQKIDATGGSLSPPTTVSADYYSPSAAIAFGDDTVAFLSARDADSNLLLAMTRLGPAGEIVTAAHKILSGPDAGVPVNGFARRGSDIVAAPAFDRSGRLILMRITP